MDDDDDDTAVVLATLLLTAIGLMLLVFNVHLGMKYASLDKRMTNVEASGRPASGIVAPTYCHINWHGDVEKVNVLCPTDQ